MVLGRVQTHEQDVAGGRMASPRAVLCRETTPPCQLHPTSVPPRLISPLPPDTQKRKFQKKSCCACSWLGGAQEHGLSLNPGQFEKGAPLAWGLWAQLYGGQGLQ